jgi:hypothetical protein
MSYYIYELVEGPAYPELVKKQRAIAWASAKSHPRRAALDVLDVIFVYGAEVSKGALESVVEKETGLKTPWLRFTLNEFAERLKTTTYHEEALAPTDDTMAPAEEIAPTGDVTMAPAEEHAPTGDATMAPMDVTMAAAEAPAPADEITLAQEFLRGCFAAATLATPARRGRPKAPVVCARCKLDFNSSDAKYNHTRRGRCIPM